MHLPVELQLVFLWVLHQQFLFILCLLSFSHFQQERQLLPALLSAG